MQFSYDSIKATQTAAYFIQAGGGVKNYTALVKLIYLADREALVSHGSPITGAAAFAMPNGMVPSEVLDEVKSAKEGTYWRDHIAYPSGYDVQLTSPVPPAMLSDEETNVLSSIQSKFGSWTFNQLIEYTHKLPEYQDPGTSSIRIDPELILRKAGVKEEHIREIGAQAEMQMFHKTISE